MLRVSTAARTKPISRWPDREEVRQDEEDGVLVVHVDEVEVQELVVGVEEDEGLAQLAEGLDVLAAQLGPEDDESVRGLGERDVEDLLDGRRLEGDDLEGVPRVLRLVAEALDVVRDEDVVVSIDGVAVPGDVEEAERAGPGAFRGRISEVLRRAENLLAQLLPGARLVVEDERYRRRRDTDGFGDVLYANAHLVENLSIGIHESVESKNRFVKEN